MLMEWHLRECPEVLGLESNLAGHTHPAAERRVEEGGLRLFPGTRPELSPSWLGPELYSS